MSETETKRTALIGVGPQSRTLKFLNNKNNIATSLLSKKLALIERQSLMAFNQLEHQRLDTQDFLKNVKALETDTSEAQELLKKGETREVEKKKRDRKPKSRKIRLAHTAPGNMQLQGPSASDSRKGVKSGPETQDEKDHVLKVDRRKSMYIQLSGKGKETKIKEDVQKTILPKSNPKTLLDVMIGLNAFNYVPPPGARQVTSDLYDDIRAESRESTLGRNSIYGSSENIANKFIAQWKKNVANRKESICMKLESFDSQIAEKALQRSMSVAFSTLPEDYESDDNFVRRKPSRWNRRHSKMITPTLPSIRDDDERKEIFMAWIKEEKDKLKEEVSVYKTPEMEKLAQRRNSFVAWLKSRNEKLKPMSETPEREFNTSGASGLRNIIEEEADDEAGVPNTGDLMRTILKIKTKFRDPLDSRVQRFNNEIDKMKERDAALRNKPTTKEQRRKWLMLTKGIDAALAESSDEEDDFYWL